MVTILTKSPEAQAKVPPVSSVPLTVLEPPLVSVTVVVPMVTEQPPKTSYVVFA